jgi:hypothetical protein
LALTTSHNSLRDLKRAAERLAAARPAVATEARAFIEACNAKAAELKHRPQAENRNPQPTNGTSAIKMRITEWVEDENGVLGCEVYATDE